MIVYADISLLPCLFHSSVSGCPLDPSFCSLAGPPCRSLPQADSLTVDHDYSLSWASPTAAQLHPQFTAFPQALPNRYSPLLLSPQAHLRFPFWTPEMPFSTLPCLTKGLKGHNSNPTFSETKGTWNLPCSLGLGPRFSNAPGEPGLGLHFFASCPLHIVLIRS